MEKNASKRKSRVGGNFGSEDRRLNYRRPAEPVFTLSLIALLCMGASGLTSCKWKMKPTFPASGIAENLRQMCSKDYKLTVETRHAGNNLQAVVWKVGLFGNQSFDLQGMRKEAAETMEHVFLCATRIALSTDAPLEFIEVKMADALTGATITLWRYVPDIRDSMYQRFGDTEYFNRLVVEINIDKKHGGVAPNAAKALEWDKPITKAEFIAKQIISRARREGGDGIEAHEDLSQPSTLGVVIDNWAAIEEEGPEKVAKVTDSVQRSAKAVLKGYQFHGFRGITLRDSQGVPVNSWTL